MNKKRNREEQNEDKEDKNKRQKNEEQKEVQKIIVYYEEYRERKITELFETS